MKYVISWRERPAASFSDYEAAQERVLRIFNKDWKMPPSFTMHQFVVRVGDAELRGQPPVTGDFGSFETASLGAIEVKEAGPQTLGISPVADGWRPMNLSFLELRHVPDAP